MSGMQLQDAIRGFLVQLRADGRSEHTVRQYERHGRALIAWLNDAGIGTELDDLTPDVLARFFASDAVRHTCHGGARKAVSANAMRTSIRCLCAHLHESGLLPANPARLLRRARCAPPPPKALHADEQQRLLDVLAAADGPETVRDRMLVDLLLGTGIRIGSALALDVPDIDFAHGEIALRQTKGNRPTTALLPTAVAEKLRSFLGTRRDGPVFCADNRLSMRHAQRRLAGWFTKAGITGRSAHALRHTFATGLLAKTGDLRLVQAAMNHASIVSTTIYTSVDRSRLRGIVGA